MAGIGGMGVLTAGQLLARAALAQYPHVSWVPSYAVAKRGGLCECTVVFSEEEIASPLLDQAQAVVVFEASQLKSFENRVRPRGVLVIEAAGLNEEKERGDITVIPVPALEIAVSLGQSQASNLVLLGAYVEATRAIDPRLVEQELQSRLGGREQVLSLNLEAFHRGLKLGAKPH